MAILECNMFSNCIGRTITFNAVIPVGKNRMFERVDDEVKPFKTLYLLHGILNNHMTYLTRSRIQELAEEHNLAVIMPSGEYSFYVDNPNGCNFGQFIGEELVEETRKMFNLSKRREDTFIAGLSMGGYGALRNGFKYNKVFSKIGAMSSAAILWDIINTTDHSIIPPVGRGFYENIFGDLDKLDGSDKDLKALVVGLKEKKEIIPEIFMACGTEDFLLENNRKFVNFLKEEGIEFIYNESAGAHEWVFWNEYLEKIIKWLL